MPFRTSKRGYPLWGNGALWGSRARTRGFSFKKNPHIDECIILSWRLLLSTFMNPYEGVVFDTIASRVVPPPPGTHSAPAPAGGIRTTCTTCFRHAPCGQRTHRLHDHWHHVASTKIHFFFDSRRKMPIWCSSSGSRHVCSSGTFPGATPPLPGVPIRRGNGGDQPATAQQSGNGGRVAPSCTATQRPMGKPSNPRALPPHPKRPEHRAIINP